MITVKIRDFETADPTFAGRVPFSEIDSFINRLRRDGVDRLCIDRTMTLSTQWVLDEDLQEFYLEVVIGEEDE